MRKQLRVILGALLLLMSSHARADEAEKDLALISNYQPTYFLLGHPDTKAQFSFKAQILRPYPVYFGFTQLILWDLFKVSRPIREINYHPELYYRFHLGDEGDRDWFDFVPYEHESNGKAELLSRSWNRTSLVYHAKRKWSSSVEAIWRLKLSIPVFREETNLDLPQYRGIWELSFTLGGFLGGYFEADDLTVRIYPGGRSWIDPFKGGQELTFRTKAKWGSLLLPAVLQFFHGYGEDLLEYKQNRIAFRAGLGF